MVRLDEFMKFVRLVKNLNPSFIPVAKNSKSPGVPAGVSWKNARLSVEEAVKRIREGKNVGLVPDGRLIVIDLDVKYQSGGIPEKRDQILDVLLKKLPETLTVRTPSGGYHLYYLNKGNVINFDFARTVNNGNIVHIGEVRVNDRYVVAPGSSINGNVYEVVKEIPPSPIGMEDFPEELIPETLHARPPAGEGMGGADALPIPNESLYRNKYGWPLSVLIARQPKIAKLLTEIHPEGFVSPSEADQSLACILYFWEFDYDTYVKVMKAYRSRVKGGKQRLERGDYLQRTWQKAKEYVKETISSIVDPNVWNPEFNMLPDKVVKIEEITHIKFKALDPIVDEDIWELVNQLPENHFLRKFMDAMSKRSDTYPEYLLLAGLYLLSVATLRRVKIPLSIGDVWPNIWGLIIGQSTLSRKTTVLDFVRDITNNPQLYIYRGSEDFSPEGLLTELSEEGTRFYIIDEFARLLAVMRKTWGEGLADVLMNLYGCKNLRRRLRKNTYDIKEPFVCMIGATTPVNLLKNSDQDLLTSGFYPRFLIVAPQRKKETKPIKQDPRFSFEMEQISECLGNLVERIIKTTQNRDGSFKVINATFKDEERMSEIVNNIVVSDDEDEVRKEIALIFQGRYNIYTLKIALLLKLGEPQFIAPLDKAVDLNMLNGIEIENKYLDLAEKMVRNVFLKYAYRVSDDIMLASTESKISRVVGLLRKYRKLTHSELLRYSHLTSREFREVIGTLGERGDIVIYEDKRGTAHYVYVGKKG